VTDIRSLGTYLPGWDDGGTRVLGPDEDMLTVAVAAGRGALAVADDVAVSRVVLVCAEPDYLSGAPLPVLIRGLGLGAGIPAELRVGGGPAALDAAAQSSPGTLVIGVETGARPGAAAALVGTGGLRIEQSATVQNSLPMRVHASGESAFDLYVDGRVERELGWRPVIEALAGASDKPVLVGVPPKEAGRLGGRPAADAPEGAAGALFALAWMAEQLETGRLVALDSAVAVAVTIGACGDVRIAHDVRRAIPAADRPQRVGAPLTIPMSMPSYGRAVEEKVGLLGWRCPDCGMQAYPRRDLCLGCRRMGGSEPFALPRRGEVYSTVTVHAPVPGITTPRGLAVVSLPPTSVRVLAHVTDTVADGCAIGDTGDLVLRLVAIREGVPDYGYAFRPDVSDDGQEVERS
jgi:uncharacterized protein